MKKIASKPKIIINFPELDVDSPEYTKIKHILDKWANDKKSTFALTTGEMKLYKVKDGDDFELYRPKLKKKIIDWIYPYIGVTILYVVVYYLLY